MITLIPGWDEINQFSTSLTDGERHFIERLEALYAQDLERDFHVFVQANINGDKPDIVVMERSSGIWVIEVKDWQLAHYAVENGRWVVTSSPERPVIKSPFRQAERYKKNFFSLHSAQLARRNLFNNRAFGGVRAAVYFHVASTAQANHLHQQEVATYQGLRHIQVFGQDCTDQNIRYFFNRPNIPIALGEYDHLLRYLMPSEVSKERLNIVYNSQQKRLIKSQAKRQKIKGVAGSGKSLVLAARAVDALARTQGKILILTFNITLVNYLHDRISDVRGTYKRRDFEIASYHAFISAECNNLGVEVRAVDEGETSYFDNVQLFEAVKHKIQRYDAIFIDEIQDFKYEWQRIIETYFLKPNAEFVIFGDEKQNLYGRELEKQQMKTVIPGAWNKLTQSHRLSKKTIELAETYQQYFFKDRYALEPIEPLQITLDLDAQKAPDQLQYVYTRNPVSIIPYLLQFIEKNAINTDDLVFIGNRKSSMRAIESELRRRNYHTLPMFLREEEYRYITENIPWQYIRTNTQRQYIAEKERELERPLKVGFWMQSGQMKLSTIQSFKGWEANHVFLIVEPGVDGQETIDELIYTGLTRCKRNLFVINVDSTSLHAFFEQNRALFDVFNVTELQVYR
ncbi:MAG: NERD domain-containing protein [Solibacillus sp.]